MKSMNVMCRFVLTVFGFVIFFQGCRKNMPSASVAVISQVPSGEANQFAINVLYYTKYARAGNDSISIPIVSDSEVADIALQRAADLCSFLINNSGVHTASLLRAQQIYVAIIPDNKFADVLPDWPYFWDSHRRDAGFGPATYFRTCGFYEGDISGSVASPNRFARRPGENVSLHEFSHALKNFAFEIRDSTFSRRVQQHFETVRLDGLWNNTYAATNAEEYWAMGAESYFNRNITGPPGGDSVYNDISSRAKLKAYDSFLFSLIDSIYQGAELPDSY